MINSISSNSVNRIEYLKRDESSEQQIKFLRQQESQVQKQIESIKNSKQDAKTKQELIKPLQEQIQNIESQIEQIQISDASDKNSEANTSKVSSNAGKNSEISKDSLFLSMSSVYKQVGEVNSIKKGLTGRARELNSYAEIDDGIRNYRMADIERKQASEYKGRALGLEAKVGKLIHSVNDTLSGSQDKNELKDASKNDNIANEDAESNEVKNKSINKLA
ncbi:FlxA-like family protein [Clostridium fermenticellae]|uniref:FlxA-like family protein n=1 Tax=Clostridium fermenticellae TaxID=2068654 RepID=UPI0013C40521|nr:FlxA-like family protein [Clostridium fermenticellae]